VAVAVLLGIVGGRLAWSAFAASAGVAPQPTVPAALILFTVPAAVALANVIAALPGWQAARLRPAAALRAQ
jgi:hypothetical protein